MCFACLGLVLGALQGTDPFLFYISNMCLRKKGRWSVSKDCNTGVMKWNQRSQEMLHAKLTAAYVMGPWQ